jgi:hypothetical protein
MGIFIICIGGTMLFIAWAFFRKEGVRFWRLRQLQIHNLVDPGPQLMQVAAEVGLFGIGYHVCITGEWRVVLVIFALRILSLWFPGLRWR